MYNTNNWDWEGGKKIIADLGEWKGKFEYMEEPHASPNGERIAAIIKTEEGEFCICENGSIWENTFDKIWYFTIEIRIEIL